MRNSKRAAQRYNLRIKAYKVSIFVLPFYALYLMLHTYSFAQKPLLDDSVQGRDPFIALVTSDGRLLKLNSRSSGQIELEGIVYDQQGLSYAIVNKEILGIGDWVGEYQVYKIDRDKVIFLKQGKEIEVKFKEE